MACAGVSLRADPSPTSSLRWLVQRPEAIAVVDNTIYVATQTPIVPRGTGGALTVFSTVDAVTSPSPAADNLIFATESDGAGGWYVGGAFSTIGGVQREGLAHVRADGSVNPNFSVTFTGGSLVASLVRVGTQLVIGGSFAAVNGVPRVGVAILDSTTGAVLPVNPVIDGGAYAVAVSGSTLLVGGAFSTAGGQPRANLAAFSLATGALVTAFIADTDGRVTKAVASGGALFVVGGFSTVNAAVRYGMAKVALASGTVDAAWNPTYYGGISTLAVDGGTVYVGGSFTEIGGQPRANLAALDIATGAATPWRADTDSVVTGLAVDGTSLFVAGAFTVAGGQYRRGAASVSTANGVVSPWYPALVGGTLDVVVANGRVAFVGFFDGWHAREARGLSAIDLRTGELLPWAPRVSSQGIPSVRTIVAAGTQLVIGGDFTGVGGYTREYLGSFDLATRAVTPLALAINGPVNTAAAIGGVLYVGGEFTSVNGLPRRHLFAVEVATGQLLPWAPEADANVSTIVAAGGRIFVGGFFSTVTDGAGAKTRAGLAEITPAGTVTSFDVQAVYPGVSGSVTRIAIDGTRVFLTGTFSSIHGVARERTAAVDATTAALLPWHPRTDQAATGMAVHRGAVYLAGPFTTVSGQPAPGLARVDDTAGTLSSWTPSPAPTLGFDVRAVESGLVYFGGVADAPALKRLWFYPEGALGGAPGAPEDVSARIENGTLSLTWARATIGATPASYVLEAGSTPGAANIGTLALSAPSFTVPGVPPGVYYLRVRAVNAAGVSAASTEIRLVAGAAGCIAVPPPPEPPSGVVNGATVSLLWFPSPGASTSSYTLHVGSAAGLANLGTTPLGASAFITANGVPAGVYFARVIGANACGSGGPSPDAVLRVGSVPGPPTAPVHVTGTVAPGGVVSLSWLTSAGGGAPTSQVLEVGNGPGLANLGTVSLGTATSLTAPGVPAGTYYLRVRAVNAAGASPVSGELVLVVP
jgi:Domain of unknown function (DUF5122) beta-propeller